MKKAAKHKQPSTSDKPLIMDSHCHLDFAAFDDDRQRVLENCWQSGITDIVIPGVLASQWHALQDFCITTSQGLNTRLHYALGLHPEFIDQHQDQHIQLLDDHISKDRQTLNSIIAVGEIGLDFFDQQNKQEPQQSRQLEIFEQQLELAQKHDLPVILHARKSHDQTLKLLNKYQIKGGIAHAFNGSIQQANKYIDYGFKLGFGGMLTFERSRKLRELAKQLPLSAIVLETDSPDMTVAQHQGKRNSPEYLPYVLSALAEIRTESIETIAEVTTNNAKTVLAIN